MWSNNGLAAPTEEITQKAIFSSLVLSSILRPVSTGWGSAHHAALLLPLLFISCKLFQYQGEGLESWQDGCEQDYTQPMHVESFGELLNTFNTWEDEAVEQTIFIHEKVLLPCYRITKSVPGGSWYHCSVSANHDQEIEVMVPKYTENVHNEFNYWSGSHTLMKPKAKSWIEPITSAM